MKHIIRWICSVALSLMGATILVSAQPAPIANVPGTNPVLYGLPVHCSDVNGVPVHFVFGNINDIAISSLDNAGPVMTFSTNAQTAPRPLLLFFYAHECMHHALGHIYNVLVLHQYPSQTREVDADCGAAKLVRDQGLVNSAEISYVASTFVNNPPIGPYPAGPIRAQNIMNCYNNPP